MIGLDILILVIMVCLYGLMLWCVVQWYNAGRRRAAEKRENDEFLKGMQAWYDTSLARLKPTERSHQAEETSTEYKAWTKKFDQAGR